VLSSTPSIPTGFFDNNIGASITLEGRAGMTVKQVIGTQALIVESFAGRCGRSIENRVATGVTLITLDNLD
jgi:hypothetical protein